VIYSFGDCELDATRFELRRAGRTVAVERQVFDVLFYLVRNRERLVTKDELLDAVWGDKFVGEAALNSRVMSARKAIGDSGKEQRLIKTIRGRGFRFVAAVTEPAVAEENGSERYPAETAPPPPTPELKRSEQHIRFCTTADGVRLAYATLGSGPPLVKAPNWLSHLEYDWRSPIWRHWLEELSRDHTFIRYDTRANGLSDWDVDDQSFEAWVRDLETVVDAAGLETFPLLGISQGGPVAIAYAVRHPERVSRLLLYGSYAKGWRLRVKGDEELQEQEAVLTLMRRGWGRDDPTYRQIFASSFIPGATLEQMRWFNDLCRVSTSPENAVRFRETSGGIDVTGLLSQVSCPTLVLHARGDLRVNFEQGRVLAAGIPGARFVPLEGVNHILLEDEPAWPVFLREAREFLGVAAAREEAGMNIQTILFTDVEGSTELTHELGDAKARELFRAHEAIIRRALALHGGSEIKTLGDGFMAAFKSATRALECAVAIQRGIEADPGGLRVRVGLNAGEPIAEGDDLFGTSVILASRLAGKASGGEILVSDVVRQLASGKGFAFNDRGRMSMKGYAEPVHVFELRWDV
jgi:class 3 adenylate cyclase/pimeloyl-ACP methyl ester carboxylesterase/DNA-binding winged helix-turn-helix (wHTH) protein